MPYVENDKEFIERQGCPYENSKDGESLYFENGAYCGMGGKREPSNDPATLIDAKLYYHTLVLKRKEDEFHRLKKTVHENISLVRRSSGVLPIDWNGALAHLKKLQGEVLHHRQRCAELKEEYRTGTEQGREAQRRQERQLEQKRETERRVAGALEALDALEI